MFTEEEKNEILKKSDGKCSHCGKKIFACYNTTVDHFVPISLGGTNKNINLIALCPDCNQKKSNLVFRPKDYLVYLKKDELEKIDDYFDSFVLSFEYINHNNLLACDRYQLKLSYAGSDMAAVMYRHNKKKAEALLRKCATTLWLKRAIPEDKEKLVDFYAKCLKKYGHFADMPAAIVNIDFWMNFGCIYYVEVQNEVQCMATVTFTKSPIENKRYDYLETTTTYHLTMDVFSYYASERACNLANVLIEQIPNAIATEQGLRQLPVRIRCLDNDPVGKLICRKDWFYTPHMINACANFMFGEAGSTYPAFKKDEKLNKFFSKFKILGRDEAEAWIAEQYGSADGFGWILNEIEEVLMDEVTG